MIETIILVLSSEGMGAEAEAGNKEHRWVLARRVYSGGEIYKQ